MMHKYSIYHIRCACSGYDAAYLTRSIRHFLKCKLCKRSLGDMDVDFLGYVRAKGEFLAMEEFRKGNYEKNKKELRLYG